MKLKLSTLYIVLITLFSTIVGGCSSGTKKSQEATSQEPETKKPNIVIIYTDDLGYGDTSCYGSTEISTPNIDKLAAEGIRFTTGYCTSATCTPSRYGLLTGLYPWKNKNAHILPGDAPLLITPNSNTLPQMLRESGYKTGIVGKWHLGLGDGDVNWNKKVSPTTLDVGFDYEFIMAATNDRVPTVFLENGLVQGLDPNDPIEINYKENFPGEPTGKKNKEMLKLMWSHGHNYSIVNGIGRIGYMKGGEKAKWVDENMADTFLVRAQNFILENKDEPFFLYYALPQPHVPRTPHGRFVGTTDLGARGDAIVEADYDAGEIIKTLDKLGLRENTIIIFSSDNGPVLDDGYNDESETRIGNHTPRADMRGGKYSMFEAGTRVPFIISWKGTIEPQTSDALVCQLDLKESIGSLLGFKREAGDGINTIDAFMGKDSKGRTDLVTEAMGKVAYRNGDWSLILPHKGGKIVNKFVKNETGNDTEIQLYNVKKDRAQKYNVAKDNPELVKELTAKFRAITGDYIKH